MRLIATLSVICMALSGCMTDLGSTGDGLARSAAKGVVNGVVESKLPGVDATPVTDCIIDNASGSEILTIAEAAVVGTTPATTNLVMEIAGRPDTQRCAASNLLGINL